jgi:hypothetical protein
VDEIWLVPLEEQTKRLSSSSSSRRRLFLIPVFNPATEMKFLFYFFFPFFFFRWRHRCSFVIRLEYLYPPCF